MANGVPADKNYFKHYKHKDRKYYYYDYDYCHKKYYVCFDKYYKEVGVQ